MAISSWLQRLSAGMAESGTPPLSIEAVKRLLSPKAGKYGVGKTLEDLGGKIVKASEGIKRRVEDTRVVNNPYVDAAIKTPLAVILDEAGGLSPSGLQVNLGAEVLGGLAGRAASRPFPRLAKVAAEIEKPTLPSFRYGAKRTINPQTSSLFHSTPNVNKSVLRATHKQTVTDPSDSSKLGTFFFDTPARAKSFQTAVRGSTEGSVLRVNTPRANTLDLDNLESLSKPQYEALAKRYPSIRGGTDVFGDVDESFDGVYAIMEEIGADPNAKNFLKANGWDSISGTTTMDAPKGKAWKQTVVLDPDKFPVEEVTRFNRWPQKRQTLFGNKEKAIKIPSKGFTKRGPFLRVPKKPGKYVTAEQLDTKADAMLRRFGPDVWPK